MTRFPKPLRTGDRIGVTAPSSGVTGPALQRLDLVLAHLESRGYDVVEGRCLRDDYKDTSAPREQRAKELTDFLLDPRIAAVFPPWGGIRASELLDLLDFERLRQAEPKWFLGYSDLSTLHLPLATVAGWATAHGPNLMDLVPQQRDPLTAAVFDVLGSDWSRPVLQNASSLHQSGWSDFGAATGEPFALTEATRWKRLDGSTDPVSFHGRLIGGCIDTIAWLAGSAYADVAGFSRAADAKGLIVYLENAELAPSAVLRALLALRRHGWFDDASGVLIGRTARADDAPDGLSYDDAVAATLGDLACPIVYDVDIGHLPPQMTLINGSMGHVQYAAGTGCIEQTKD
jgi:muramoyltetrapeptide carboxypeptidase LdcA involved in peptidoglycan recycling